MLPWHSAKLIHLKFGLYMEGMSGKLFFFFLPIMLAYNHFLQNHPAYIPCPEPGDKGDERKGQKSSVCV